MNQQELEGALAQAKLKYADLRIQHDEAQSLVTMLEGQILKQEGLMTTVVQLIENAKVRRPEPVVDKASLVGDEPLDKQVVQCSPE